MSHRATLRRVVTDFVLRISDQWSGRAIDAAEILALWGADVTYIGADERVLAGTVESTQADRLSALPCVQSVVTGASHVVGDGSGPKPGPGSPGRGGYYCQQYVGSEHDHAGAELCRQDVSRADARRSRRWSAPRLPEGDGTEPWAHRRLAPKGERPIGNLSDGIEPVDCSASPDEAPGAARKISSGVRLAYVLVTGLATCLLAEALLAGTGRGWYAGLVVHGCGIASLIALSVMCAMGLCRYRVVRHTCTGLGLLLTVSPLLLPSDSPYVGASLGLLTMLIAGAAAECLSQSE